MPIYNKILLGFGVIILLMILSNAYVLLELNDVSKTANTTLTTDVRAIDAAKQLQDLLDDQEGYAQKFLIAHDPAYYSLFVDSRSRIEPPLRQLLGFESDSLETMLIGSVRRTYGWFIGQVEVERDAASDPRGRELISRQISDSLGAIHNMLTQTTQMRQASIGRSITAFKTTTDRSAAIAVILASSTLLAAIILAVLIAHTITRPIDVLIKGTGNIARGTFEAIRVRSHDETARLAEAFNDMSTRLKRINELKAELMQQISHELRTPLSTILGAHFMLSTGRAGQMSEEQSRLLEVIRESVDKLTVFSHQFLDIAKIEAGMMEYRYERMDLLSILRPAVEVARMGAAQKNITITLKSAPIPEIRGDREKLSIVIGNLLNNAIKFTRDSGRIDVVVGSGGLGVQIAVTDSGIGIAPEDLPHVFTKFYQARNSTSTAGFKGSGVGLALVKAFTEGHGGKVSVMSAVNQGSVFTVEFPAASPLPHEQMHQMSVGTSIPQ